MVSLPWCFVCLFGWLVCWGRVPLRSQTWSQTSDAPVHVQSSGIARSASAALRLCVCSITECLSCLPLSHSSFFPHGVSFLQIPFSGFCCLCFCFVFVFSFSLSCLFLIGNCPPINSSPWLSACISEQSTEKLTGRCLHCWGFYDMDLIIPKTKWGLQWKTQIAGFLKIENYYITTQLPDKLNT